MNWLVKRYVGRLPIEKKEALLQIHKGCEHVKKDASTLAVLSFEYDRFGSEVYCCCRVCDDFTVCGLEEEHCCCDCQERFKTKDLLTWKAYNAYPAQGDEFLWICATCQTLPKHIERVLRDRQNCEDELSRYDDHD